MKTILIWLFAFLLMRSSTAIAADIDYQVYMRAPVGMTQNGGKEIQIINPGSEGDEFRTGNEVAYAEAYFTAHLMKPVTAKDPYFDTNMTFAYNPSMNSQYGDTTPTTDNVQVIQLFARGGNFDGNTLSFWAGKRFYRDVDVNMDDFYYFANMSGNGAGIEGVDLGNGSLSVALLQSSTKDFTDATNGNPSKQVLDLRWRNLGLTDHDHLQLWLAEAYSAPGTGTMTTVNNGVSTSVVADYDAAHGTAAGTRWQHDLDNGFNNFAVLYGTSIMENLSLDGDVYALAGTRMDHKKRWRVVEHYSRDFSEKWGLQTALIYEGVDSGASAESQSHWYSIGARPTYYITDHYHLVFEVGHSIVRNAAEITASGLPAGDRTLTRATISPEFAFGRGLYNRPVVRAFLTYSQWNDANKDTSNPNSLISNLNSQKIVALNNMSGVVQVGFECEAWF